MTPLNPPPETETLTETPIYDFIPGDLEPLAPAPKRFPQFKLPVALTQSWAKHAFRPIFFSALGIHGLMLFTPLSTPTQVKAKETAEPVKIKRLSDKVLVKSMPKVKVTTAAKPTLPKVAVAASNPIVIASKPEPLKDEKKPDEKKPDEKKPDEKKPEEKKPDEKTDSKSNTKADSKSSDKGEDPSKVDPKKATTNANEASDLDKESQPFATVVSELRATLNPGEADAEADSGLLEDPKPFFNVTPPPKGNTLISNLEVDDVEAQLKGKFTAKFSKKANYGGGILYEAQIGTATRYISLVKVDHGKGVMVFLWDKSPV